MVKIIVDGKQNRQKERGKKKKTILESSSIKTEVQIRDSIGEDLEKEYLGWMGRRNEAGPKRERM